MRQLPLFASSLVSAALAFSLSTGALAADFYVDPASGSAGGDGSTQNPWQSLDQVIASGAFGTTVKAGDTVWLRSGYHGALTFNGGDYTPPILVAAESGQAPQAASLAFKGAKGLTVRGLSISPSHSPSPAVGDIVLMDKASAHVTVENSQIFSVGDSSGWGIDEWINAASSGVFIRGTDCAARNNLVTNVRFGISVDGKGALVEGNSVVNFSADGLRGLGDDGVFQYNLIKNVYVSQDDGDSNHDDGFQSWSVGANGVGTGVVKNVTLRGNMFINREDPEQKLTNTMQGIGCFDGFFEGWVVENNVVITDHWHGISFYGMKSSRIVNNTVIDVNSTSPGPPWIKVTAHKDGTPSDDILVRNNLATDFQLEGTALTEDHNTKLTDLAAFFVDPPKFDLHLLPDAPAVDTGNDDMAPALDIEKIPRPQGKAVDLGAYEWHEPGVEPGTGGGGTGGTGGAGGDSTGGTSPTGSGGSGASDIGGGAGGDPMSGEDGGCGCTTATDPPARPLWLLAGLRGGLWRGDDVAEETHNKAADSRGRGQPRHESSRPHKASSLFRGWL
ncbi:MAG: right-handed parallel beta-helix repeat-containing protein [Polyangiaceae bacterium]